MARQPTLSLADCEAIGAQYASGTKVDELVRSWGVSPATVYKALDRAGIETGTIQSRKRHRTYVLEPRPVTRERHLIADISYAREWIRCSCGTEITARADELERDRHQPLVNAWTDHRRAVGARVLSLAQDAMYHRAYS